MGSPFDRIYHRGAEDLSFLPRDSITLTVTSPPYWNAIDYDRHTDNPDQDYRTRSYSRGGHSYMDYIDWLGDILGQVLSRTVPGGFLAVVIGTVLLDGRHYPVPMDLTSTLSRKGWEFWQDILWNKVTGGVKRAGQYIQRPYPGYYRPNIMTEYILVFRKPGDPMYRSRTRDEKMEAARPINRLFTSEIANNVWHIAPVPPRQLDHPCPFPEEIPHRLVHLYSYPGDVVMDPFCGSGQTTKVARHLGRRYVGLDIEERYVEYSRGRLNEPLSVREMQLISRMEKIHIDEPRAGAHDGKRGATRHGSGRRG